MHSHVANWKPFFHYENRPRLEGSRDKYPTSCSHPTLHAPHVHIKASAGPAAVPNEGPLQTYNQLTQLRAPKTAGPGAAAPLAPPLMRHITGDTTVCLFTDARAV